MVNFGANLMNSMVTAEICGTRRGQARPVPDGICRQKKRQTAMPDAWDKGMSESRIIQVP